MSEWSGFVSSNESVSFSHQFDESGSYSIMVRAQDELGLNSSWSPPFSFTVLLFNKTSFADEDIITRVNNETGETQFSVDLNNSAYDPANLIWEFEDGVILEGTSPVYRYLQPGTYSITLTITERDGSVKMKTFSVTIPEPQQDVDTPIGSSEANVSSFPWIFVLIGIILSMIAVVFIVKLR